MRNPSSKAVWGAVLALGLLLPATGMAAGQSRGKLDRALQELSLSSAEVRDVIIRVAPGRTRGVKEVLDRRHGDAKVHGLIDAISARLSAGEIEELLDNPDVEGVSLDADVSALAADRSPLGTADTRKKPGGLPTDPGDGGTTVAVAQVKQILGLSDRFTGATATVAIIDSGIAPVGDFDNRILGQYVFTGGRLGLYSPPFDDYGHGTHVAGLIGSNGTSSNNKYGGVAPAAKLLSLKVLDKKGSGKTTDVIRALEFAVTNKSRFGITVVNLSLGHPVYESALTDPLVQAVEAAVRAGIVVVVAAGNYGTNPLTGATGYAGIASPGNAPSAITVGAAKTNNTIVRIDDRLAEYSSRGPSWYDGFGKPDIVAPGQGLVSNDAVGSTLDILYPSLIVQSGYTRYLRLSGSSMATAVVSGLAAVMTDANQAAARLRWDAYQDSLKRNQRGSFAAPPALTANAIKALLQYSATPLRNDEGIAYNALEQGAGLVNGAGAVTLSSSIDTTMPAGAYWMTVDTLPVTTFGGVDEVWSQSAIWGTRLLRGTSIVALRQLAWEDNVVWGTGELQKIVWGTLADGEDNIVWGTLAGSEDNIVWGTSIPLSTTLTWAGNVMLEDNIVWGSAMTWDDNVVWGTNLVGFFDGTAVIWGSFSEDNIVWGTLSEDNIVWGTSARKVNVLGTSSGGGL